MHQGPKFIERGHLLAERLKVAILIPSLKNTGNKCSLLPNSTFFSDCPCIREPPIPNVIGNKTWKKSSMIIVMMCVLQRMNVACSMGPFRFGLLLLNKLFSKNMPWLHVEYCQFLHFKIWVCKFNCNHFFSIFYVSTYFTWTSFHWTTISLFLHFMWN